MVHLYVPARQACLGDQYHHSDQVDLGPGEGLVAAISAGGLVRVTGMCEECEVVATAPMRLRVVASAAQAARALSTYSVATAPWRQTEQEQVKEAKKPKKRKVRTPMPPRAWVRRA